MPENNQSPGGSEPGEAGSALPELSDLAGLAGQGDEQAFNQIMERLWEESFGFMRSRFYGDFSEQEAEDVVQSAFITAWQKLPAIREPRAFKSWFYTILIRKGVAAKRLVRAQQVFIEPQDGEHQGLDLLTPELAEELNNATEGSGPFRHLVRQELVSRARSKIENVYQELTLTRRKVFVARYVNLFNETEAAKMTGLPIGTIRSSTSFVANLLRQEFCKEDFKDVSPAQGVLAVVEALGNWQTH